MSKRLSAIMIEAIRAARAHGGSLVRWQGGFWTYVGCPKKADAWPRGEAIPSWYVEAHTINALVRRGAADVTERDVLFNYPTRITVRPDAPEA